MNPRTWDSQPFRGLSVDEQLIALYVRIAQTNRIGIGSFSIGKACEDLGMSPKAFLKGFLKVCQILQWEWDAEARVLYISTWWQDNSPESVNTLVGNLKDLADLPATPLLERFSENTAYLSDDLKKTFIQALAKGYPHPSPHPSTRGTPSPLPQKQEQKQAQKQEQETPPAVELGFEEFWESYPKRNGKRLDKPKALKKFSKLSAEEKQSVLVAVKHYENSALVKKGIGVRDPHRWLQDGDGNQPWRDWVEPEQPTTTLHNGHGPSRTCTKRIQGPDDRFLRFCGQPASPHSRPTERRCTEHLTKLPSQEEPHANN